MQEEIKPGDNTTHNNPETVSCKNCSHSFTGNFCPQCGQSKKDFDRPLKFFLVDFAGNVFAFDTRLWQSLKHILLFPVYAMAGVLRVYKRHWLTTGIRLLVLICTYLFVAAMVTAFIVYLSFT